MQIVVITRATSRYCDNIAGHETRPQEEDFLARHWRHIPPGYTLPFTRVGSSLMVIDVVSFERSRRRPCVRSIGNNRRANAACLSRPHMFSIRIYIHTTFMYVCKRRDNATGERVDFFPRGKTVDENPFQLSLT